MAVKRDMEVPAVERVEMVRVGRIVNVEALPGGVAVSLDAGDLKPFLVPARRAMVSSDAAGDQMRPGVWVAEYAGIAAWLKGSAPAVVVEDWLWAEAKS